MVGSVADVREYLNGLPNETERAYERQIVDLVMANDSDDFIEKLQQIMQSDEDKSAFAAFCALCELHRRKKDFSKHKKLLDTYKDRFGDHPFFSHIVLLNYINNFEYAKKDEIYAIAFANAQNMPGNAGAHHALAEIVAEIFEYAELNNTEPASAEWLDAGLQAVNVAVSLDPGYAKFYCTKARLLSLCGKYDVAFELIKKAVDLEDSRKSDYAIRINTYLGWQIQIQARKQAEHVKLQANAYMKETIEQYIQKVDAEQQKLKDQAEETANEMRGSALKNLEFIGLFAGIVSFTIGSISISSALAEFSFAGAAGLIIVLMGALLCAFSGFGFVLHTTEHKKDLRSLMVLGIGLLSLIIGIIICCFIPR